MFTYIIPKKPIPSQSTFGVEITLALLLKFLLLGGLWWLFFAGQKQPVNGDIIADKLFGEHPAVSATQSNKGDPL